MLGSGDVFVTGPAATIDDVRPRCKRFRILVMGVRNAGKTTILQRMCNTNGDPVVRDKHGRKIDSAILEPSTERGISDIEHEITFPSNPGFVFHDSRGIEAGSASELNIVEHFIASRAVCRNLEDQLHTIWYCLPVSGARPLSDAEMKFFEHGTGAVPVIAIFTKFEGQILLARQKLRRDGVPLAEAKVQAIDLANRNFQDNLLKRVMSTKYPPLYYVCFQELHKKDADCSELTQKTADALSDNILQQLFAVVQQNNIQVSIKGGLRGIMESIGRFQDDFYIIRHLFLFILPWVRRVRWDPLDDLSSNRPNWRNRPDVVNLFRDNFNYTHFTQLVYEAVNPESNAQIIHDLNIAIETCIILQYAAKQKEDPASIKTAVDIYQQIAPGHNIRKAVSGLYHQLVPDLEPKSPHEDKGHLLDGLMKIISDNALLVL